MNYYRYANYHHSYSQMYSSRAFLTGAAFGAIPATTLALPAAYHYFKNRYKYTGMSGYGAIPWYSSTAFSNSFGPSYPVSSGNNFSRANLYPRQTRSNYYPPSIYLTNNRGFGHLNRPDLSPNFFRNPSGSYPAYPPPKYTPSSNLPSYPAYSNAGMPMIQDNDYLKKVYALNLNSKPLISLCQELVLMHRTIRNIRATLPHHLHIRKPIINIQQGWIAMTNRRLTQPVQESTRQVHRII